MAYPIPLPFQWHMTLKERLKKGIICPTAEDLIALGEAFGKLLGDGTIIALRGDLGVGKTTFAKGIARALGIGEPLTSPTFNILAHYAGTMNLIHIDAYRLERGEYLGVLDYAQHPFVIVVEWAENLVELEGNMTQNIQIMAKKNGERCIGLI
ncbi:MAG: tRNA (adenosine(37)-N6)-threonylcarbamoyltransferase complex ATPase subunit type 1 TsaE [Puniceicoccales bacterium]|jgi:tRNA threonylcarbamoyladenosine biosynthesis protein TsaE|nr:tRNA (adenosine(37)-N6)-threonylcarbamoyltransferase complex ATPase subunit type 1 TsaE [Puniceicoccales bacterium]